MKSKKILSLPSIGRVKKAAPKKAAPKKAAPKKRISGVKKGISGSLFEKFQEVAKKTNFTLRGASLNSFLKWMNANDKAIFGKSIATKKWFALVDQYPQVIDIIGQFRIDSEPLEDEDEAKVERYYASVKKKSKVIGNVSSSETAPNPGAKLELKDFVGKYFAIWGRNNDGRKVWDKKELIETIRRIIRSRLMDPYFIEYANSGYNGVYERNFINTAERLMVKNIDETLNKYFHFVKKDTIFHKDRVLAWKDEEVNFPFRVNWMKKTKNRGGKYPVVLMDELRKAYLRYIIKTDWEYAPYLNKTKTNFK
jgi:hypothetical protein